MTSSRRTSSRSKRASPSAASTTAPTVASSPDERCGQQRGARRIDEQRLAAAHHLERLRPQLGERAALARARRRDRRLPQLLAAERPDRGAVVRQRLAQHAQERPGDVGGALGGRERARERLQVAHLLERAPRTCGHRGRAARDQPLVGERDAVLAEALGLVQRGIGRLQQVAQIAAVAGPARDAERERQPPAAEVDGRQAPLQAPADGARIGLGGLRQQQRELLAADPEHAVGRAHAAPQQHADLPQRVVAGDMPARVVELLEVVDVGEHEREAGRARGREPAHGLVEAAVVREAGERVRGRLELLALERAQALERHRGVRDQQRRVVDDLRRQRRAAAVAGEVAVRARRGAQRQAEAAALEIDAALVTARTGPAPRARGRRARARARARRAARSAPAPARPRRSRRPARRRVRARSRSRGRRRSAPPRARVPPPAARRPARASARRPAARSRAAGRRARRPSIAAARRSESACASPSGPRPAAPPSPNRRAARRARTPRCARAARRSSRSRAVRRARGPRPAAPTPRPAPPGGDTGARR